MKRTVFGFVLSFICLILLFSPVINVSAQVYSDYQSKSQYYSYEYNCYNELSPAPDGYTASEVIYSSDLELDISESKLVDLFYQGGKIYVLDSALGRVIVLNEDYSLNSVISGESITAGNFGDIDCTFMGASGIYVEDDGKILICDTEKERVLFIENNTLVGMIKRPKSSVLSKSIKFDVKKVAKAGSSYYVTAESVVAGTMMFDEDLNFVRFFGGNNVAVTAEVLLRTVQSIFMSDEQIAASRKFAASKISSLDVDENGFVVVVSSDQELVVEGSAVRCLNFKGSDITTNDTDDNFGDRDIIKSNANIFSDVAVDDENFYVLLDTKYGRVFVYAENGVLISVFGGIGKETGLFSQPVAVETVGNKVLVLDSELNAITVFNMTDYGSVKRKLLKIIDTGKYDEISRLSDELLKINTNSQYASYAKGFVAEHSGDYEKALEYYKQANEKSAYAQCFKLLRTQYVKSHFLLILIIIVSVFAAIIYIMLLLSKGLSKKEGVAYSPLECKKGFPLYCLFHPADGFSQIKIRKVLSPVWLIGILTVWIYVSILRYFSVGFIHNQNRASEFNILVELAKTVGILVVFMISNWAICTLMEGKGKLKEILYTVVYSMIPYILALIITLPLTMFLTADEAIIISMVNTIGVIWSIMVAFVGLLTIHEYSVGKAVFSLLLTIVGMALTTLLIIMFFTLIAQTVSFVQSLIQEYSFRH
ncbi:MAG: YIP1 family protein [Clostridia bacterium]|nr:YIP1 family protein [Clostridia bacterium]